MYLTNEYRLIASSERLSAAGGSYYGSFFTDTYARAVPNEITGFYTVYVKLTLVCTITSEFYGYLTHFGGKVNGQTAFSAEARQPNDLWEMRDYNGGYATVIAEGGVQVDSSDGLEHVIPITTQWTFIGSPADYTPKYGATAEASANVTLPAIPRASKISGLSSSNGRLDGEITYVLTPAGKDLKNRQTVYCNGEKLFSSNVGCFSENTTVRIDISDMLSHIYTSNTDTSEVALAVTLETYNDSAVIGSEKAEVVLLIPENDDTRPCLDSAEIFPEYIQNADFGGSYVKGKTKVGCKAEATAKYGAAIAGFRTKVNGEYQNALLQAGECKIEITATDTRGICSLPAKFTVTVYDYRVPIIVSHSGESTVVCCRCDPDGNKSDVGTDCFLRFGKLFSEIPGNVCRVNYRLRGEGEPWGEYRLLGSGNAEYSGIVGGVFPEPAKAYHIRLQIVDGGNESTTKTFPIAADRVDYQYNGNLRSWAFGSSAPSNREKAFSLGLRAYFDKGVQPVAFIENNEAFGGKETTVEDEAMLLTTADMYNYTLFVVKAAGEAEYALGIRMENIINFVGYGAYIRLGETSFTLVQGGNYQNGVGFKIKAIYGLV